MTPPTVNAYLRPAAQRDCFSGRHLAAAVLRRQGGRCRELRRDWHVIGHEMTHGFDDQGRQFRCRRATCAIGGRPRTRSAFKERAQCSSMINSLEPVPGVHDERRTCRVKTIADLGGVTIAYKALRAHGAGEAHESSTATRRSSAFSWPTRKCGAARRPRRRSASRRITDPHPNPRLRVIGTLSNMPEFRAAFECAAGAPMVAQGKLPDLVVSARRRVDHFLRIRARGGRAGGLARRTQTAFPPGGAASTVASPIRAAR